MGGVASFFTGDDLQPQTSLTTLDPPDDRYLPGYTDGLSGVGPRLRSLSTAFSTYGVDIPLSMGNRRLKGQVVWRKQLSERAEVMDGITTFRYYATFAVSFGYPGDRTAIGRRLTKIFADGQLLVDNSRVTSTSNGSFSWRWYDGSENQGVDAAIEDDLGAGFAPAFRGQMVLVLEDVPVTTFGDKIPAIEAQVIDYFSITSNFDGMTASGQNDNFNVVMADWDTYVAYVINTNPSPDGMYVYNLNTRQYFGSVPINSDGVPASGSSRQGVNTTGWFYCNWNKTFISCPSALLPRTTPYVADQNGVVLSYVEDASTQVGTIVAAKVDQSLDSAISFMSNLNEWTILYYSNLDRQLRSLRNFSSGYGFGKAHGLGPCGPEMLVAYAENSTDGDLDRVTFLPGDLAGFGNGTREVGWLPYDGSGNPGIRVVLYVKDLNAVLVTYNNGVARLVDADTGSNLWRVTGIPVIPDLEQSVLIPAGKISNGRVTWYNAGDILEMDVTTGRYDLYTTNSLNIQANSSTFNTEQGFIIGRGVTNNQVNVVEYRNVSSTRLPVSRMLEQLALSHGYTAVDIDVQATVDDFIDGIVLESKTSFDEILNLCRTLYGYDIFELGAKLVIRDKKTNYTGPDVVIPVSSLLGNKEAELIQERQEPDVMLPRRASITYMDPSLDYQWATASWSRDSSDADVQSENTIDLQAPFAMQAGEAKMSAVRAVFEPWIARTSVSFQLPREYSRVVPGDILQIDFEDLTSILVRVVDTTRHIDYTTTIDGHLFEEAAEFSVSAYSGTIPPKKVATSPTDIFLLLDIPPLKDDEVWPIEKLGFYWIAAPGVVTDTWDGTNAFIGTEFAGATSWSPLGEATIPVPVGRLTRQFPAAPEGRSHAMDNTSEINMRIIGGDPAILQSATYSAIQAGDNLAAVGAPGRWELIRYMNVTTEGDGSTTISGIMRGCLGTEWAARLLISENRVAGVHKLGGGLNGFNSFLRKYIGSLSEAGDYFVPISSSWTKRHVTEQPAPGVQHRFLAASTKGSSPGQRGVITRSHARSHPCSAYRVTRDTNGVLTVKWKGSSRFSNKLTSGARPNIPRDVVDTDKYHITIVVPTKGSPMSYLGELHPSQSLPRPMVLGGDDQVKYASYMGHQTLLPPVRTTGNTPPYYVNGLGYYQELPTPHGTWQFLHEGDPALAEQSFTLPTRIYGFLISLLDTNRRWIRRDGTLNGLVDNYPSLYLDGQIEYDYIYVMISQLTKTDGLNMSIDDYYHFNLDPSNETLAAIQAFYIGNGNIVEMNSSVVPPGFAIGRSSIKKVWVEDV